MLAEEKLNSSFFVIKYVLSTSVQLLEERKDNLVFQQ